jgi:hypothetical protein
MTVDDTIDDANYQTVRIVTEVSAVGGGPDAYVFFDYYKDATNLYDIKYRIIDDTGGKSGRRTFYAGAGSDGLGPYGFDVDVSHKWGEDRFHVVWHRNTGGANLKDIYYWSMDTNNPINWVPVNPLVVVSTTRDEKHPSIDAQFEEGFVHITYESWVTAGSRANQQIGYTVLDTDGNFLLENEQVGIPRDQDDDDGLDGKWYPQVAYAYNGFSTIAWREWDESEGYMTVRYKQFFVETEKFYDVGSPPYPISISEVFIEEERVLVEDTCSISKVHQDAVVVGAIDMRVVQSDYDLDSHIRVLFMEEIAIWNYKFNYLSTREYWYPVQDIGFMDCRIKEPDIDIDGNGEWHIVYASTRPPAHNNWEIYYRNSYNVNEKLVSTPVDAFASVTPKIITVTHDMMNIDAYIVWIDHNGNPLGELWFSMVDAISFNTMINPGRVPFVAGPPQRQEDQHEITMDDAGGIHVVFRVVNGGISEIHHGSFDLAGMTLTQDSRINRVDPHEHYSNPAIDIGPNDRPYVVYVESGNPTNEIIYDALQLNHLGGGIFAYNLWAPMELFIDNDCDYPDIKFDRFSPRNCDVAPNNPNIFAHIVWTELIAGGWSVVYAKYHPLDVDEDPEINARELHSDQSYSRPLQKADPELAITSDNDVAIIFCAQTMGYEPNPGHANYFRVFYSLLDNNGMIRSTNTYISNNHNYDIVNSASDISNDDELFVAWDTYDAVAGDYLNTVKWRTHDWA